MNAHYIRCRVARTQIATIVFRLPADVAAPTQADAWRAIQDGLLTEDWETHAVTAIPIGPSTLAEAEDGDWIDCAPGCQEVWSEPSEEMEVVFA